jgi:DnaJ-class molecular chaperone
MEALILTGEGLFDMKKEKIATFIKVKTVVPTHVGQRCPVCNGYGSVGIVSPKQCHACSGHGYILVPAEERETR